MIISLEGNVEGVFEQHLALRIYRRDISLEGSRQKIFPGLLNGVVTLSARHGALEIL